MQERTGNTSRQTDDIRVHFVLLSDGTKACYVDGKRHYYPNMMDAIPILHDLGIKCETLLGIRMKSPLPDNFSDLKLEPWEPGSCGGGAFGG